jgi:hypothetical protein
MQVDECGLLDDAQKGEVTLITPWLCVEKTIS